MPGRLSRAHAAPSRHWISWSILRRSRKLSVGPSHEAEGEDDTDPETGVEVDHLHIERRYSYIDTFATHRYRNPFCEKCMKAKMRYFRFKSVW